MWAFHFRLELKIMSKNSDTLSISQFYLWICHVSLWCMKHHVFSFLNVQSQFVGSLPFDNFG